MRARQAERFGFDGIFLLDHLLPISGVHTSAWLDTIVAMSVIAAATERIRVGSASMVVGFRHPVYLAKQLASLALVAGPRLVLGAGSGWYGPEYEAFGYQVKERGGRTDETLRALRRLLTEDDVSFRGRYWDFEAVTISPRPRSPVPVFVAGGSRVPNAGSENDVPFLAAPVLNRILAWDGWIAPCAGSEELTELDFHRIQSSLSDREMTDPPFRFLHVQWTHVVDTTDRERALREQLPAMRTLMGSHHSDQHLVDAYLLGSVDDIAGRLRALRDLGFDELIVGPVVHDPDQQELIADVYRRALVD